MHPLVISELGWFNGGLMGFRLDSPHHCVGFLFLALHPLPSPPLLRRLLLIHLTSFSYKSSLTPLITQIHHTLYNNRGTSHITDHPWQTHTHTYAYTLRTRISTRPHVTHHKLRIPSSTHPRSTHLHVHTSLITRHTSHLVHHTPQVKNYV